MYTLKTNGWRSLKIGNAEVENVTKAKENLNSEVDMAPQEFSFCPRPTTHTWEGNVHLFSCCGKLWYWLCHMWICSTMWIIGHWWWNVNGSISKTFIASHNREMWLQQSNPIILLERGMIAVIQKSEHKSIRYVGNGVLIEWKISNKVNFVWSRGYR